MLSLFTAFLLSAQPCGPLDLGQTLALVPRRSDEVGIRQAELLSAKADVALAHALGILPLSSINLLVGPVPGARGTDLPGTRIPIISTTTNRNLVEGLGPFGRLDITAIQPIWTWGAWTNAQRAAAAGVEARSLLVQDTVRQVQLRTVQLYWSAVLAKRLLAIAADVDDALTKVEGHIDASLAAGQGDISQADKFRVQVFRSDLMQKKSAAEEGLKLARVGLAATLALPEPGLQLQDGPLPNLQAQPVPPVESVIAQAERQRPDLLALDKAIQAKEAEVAAKEAQRLPMVFVGGTFAYSYAPNRTVQEDPWISDYFNTLSAGIALGVRQNLALPQLQAEVEKARAELGTLRRQREGLARLVTVEVETGVAELTSAEEKLAAAQSALGAGRAWFRSTGLNFEMGVADARSLVDAYTSYVKTQVDDAQARFEVLLARARLEELSGKTLASEENACALP